MVAPVSTVLISEVVSVDESAAKILSSRWRNVRMAKILVAASIGRTSVREIVVGRFDAGMKTLPREVGILVGRRLPSKLHCDLSMGARHRDGRQADTRYENSSGYGKNRGLYTLHVSCLS